MLISFGDCAVTGNVTALRNPLGSAEPVLRRSYVEQADLQPQIPLEPGIVPVLLDRVNRSTRSFRSTSTCRAVRRRPRASARCWSSFWPASRPHLEGREIKFG